MDIMFKCQEGEKMLAAGHPAKDKIKPRIIDLSEGWEQLLINCKEKKSRLQEAYQVHNNIIMLYIGLHWGSLCPGKKMDGYSISTICYSKEIIFTKDMSCSYCSVI